MGRILFVCTWLTSFNSSYEKEKRKRNRKYTKKEKSELKEETKTKEEKEKKKKEREKGLFPLHLLSIWDRITLDEQ